MALQISFWILAVVAVVAALAVVFLRNVFRAAFALIMSFLAIAGLYITLSADFLAVVQILVYVGAISILIILAVMLTRELHQGNPSNNLELPALIVVLLFLAAGVWIVLATNWKVSAVPPVAPTTSALAQALFGGGGFLLAVEISVVLLLAAVIGAIVLVREK
ncbi:MAG: NADH-quinone oxidoreductase subunit J [Chloroflexi bacterium]|nr:NADH-quinone oxidoreductase subunit J [Chloroflexota bacterium]